MASDFPKLWKAPTTTDKDRKRLARLILEDVTLLRGQNLTVQVRFKGGANRTLSLPLPLNGWQLRTTKPDLLQEIDHLLNDMTPVQVAAELNQRGRRSSLQLPFSAQRVRGLCRYHGVKSRQQRLEERGLLGSQAMSKILETKPTLVDYWRQQGLLKGVPLNEKHEYMYERPAPEQVKEIKCRIHSNHAELPS